MKYIFIVFFFMVQTLMGCTLCSVYAPNAHIKTVISYDNNKTDFEISWEFDSNFVKTLIVYDANNNKKFDTEEKIEIKKALLVYLQENNFLTNISYQIKDDMVEQTPFTIENPKYDFVLDMKKMIFSYRFSLDFILLENHKLEIVYFDKGNNFNFIPKDTIVRGYDRTKIIKMDKGIIQVYFYTPIETQKIVTKQSSVKEDKTDNTIQNSLLEKMSHQLEVYKQKIEALLQDIKENNSFVSYLWLLVFSFLYGVLHALGPGHGKSLVGAYFLSENRSTSKALYISILIGVVHTFSAFIMTLVVYYLLSVLFSNFFTDVEYIATKISAVIIISIALFMIYKKIKQHKVSPIHNHASSCSCGGCQSRGTDLGVIISSGIVPCPGTVTIFLFTLGLGVVYVGFLSAIFMSIGMSLVIFITAYISSKVRAKSVTNRAVVKFFEYGSLIFILLLGIILFLI